MFPLAGSVQDSVGPVNWQALMACGELIVLLHYVALKYSFYFVSFSFLYGNVGSTACNNGGVCRECGGSSKCGVGDGCDTC